MLEHLGQATEVYLGIIKELYRVCRDGAPVSIIVPHPRNDDFLTDPTHVRPITPEGLRMFSQAVNREWIEKQGAITPLALYLGVDFEIETIDMTVAEPWISRLERNKISEPELEYAVRTFSNVVQQTKIVLRALKPPAGHAEDVHRIGMAASIRRTCTRSAPFHRSMASVPAACIR